MKQTAKSDILIPIGLLLLTAIPFIAGLFRLASLAGGGPLTPDNSRFFADPLPVVIHILGATVFCVLGAWQFSPGLRRQNPRWHRISGRILVPAGIAAGLSGLWMAFAYPLMPVLQGEVLLGFRLVFGPAMVVCLVLGWVAAVQHRFVPHRAWMIRGYAREPVGLRVSDPFGVDFENDFGEEGVPNRDSERPMSRNRAERRPKGPKGRRPQVPGRGSGRPRTLFGQSVAQLRPSLIRSLFIPAPSAGDLALSPTGSWARPPEPRP